MKINRQNKLDIYIFSHECINKQTLQYSAIDTISYSILSILQS